MVWAKNRVRLIPKYQRVRKILISFGRIFEIWNQNKSFPRINPLKRFKWIENEMILTLHFYSTTYFYIHQLFQLVFLTYPDLLRKVLSSLLPTPFQQDSNLRMTWLDELGWFPHNEFKTLVSEVPLVNLIKLLKSFIKSFFAFLLDIF